MIARLHVHMTHGVFIPENETYSPFEYKRDGYTVREYFPVRDPKADAEATADGIMVDGKATTYANALKVDFIADSFNRTDGSPADPSETVLEAVINSHLLRIRHLTRGGQIRPVRLNSRRWQLTYLNDDESELPQEKGLLNVRGYGTRSASWVALSMKHWQAMSKLPSDYNPPPWDSVLLDATVELPNTGPAITLAATAHEVFISYLLEMLVKHKGVAPSLRKWLRSQGRPKRKPSVAERFDGLLKEFTGHSLKEDPKLWKVFSDTKAARNAFVHEGVCSIKGKAVDDAQAAALVAGASDVIGKIREWVPTELQWEEFKYPHKITVSMKIG